MSADKHISHVTYSFNPDAINPGIISTFLENVRKFIHRVIYG